MMCYIKGDILEKYDNVCYKPVKMIYKKKSILVFCHKTRKNKGKTEKSWENIWRFHIFAVPLHSQSGNISVAKEIGIWCNGNTADSGPAFPGSSPGIPTKKSAIFHKVALFLALDFKIQEVSYAQYYCL